MTLITVGFDTELLLRQLRQRLTYVINRIAWFRPQENADNPVTGFVATGALLELENERGWLLNLITQVEQEGVQP